MDIRPEMSLPDLAAAFIAQGRLGTEPRAEQCGDFLRVNEALLCGNDPWEWLAHGLETEELRELIRGLVLYSRAIGQAIGGSVSPVIVLYRALVERSPAREPELTSWVVANRRNRWEPFGTLNDGSATTYQAFVAYRQKQAEEQAERYRVGMLRQAADQAAKRQRDREESTKRIAAAVRRGDRAAVEALLRKDPDLKCALPDGGSLIDLALAHNQSDIAALIRSREAP